MHTENESIGRLISSYFQDIFCTELNDSMIHRDTTLSGFPSKIPPTIYDLMASDYTPDEVKRVCFPIKSYQGSGERRIGFNKTAIT